MQEQKYIQEDEIDLREIFKSIFERKYFILIFTLIITILAIIYVSIKTPIYEAKAVIEIGSYKTESDEVRVVDNLNEFSKKLSTIFIDLRKDDIEKESEITNISISKGMKNYIEISSQAISNDLALKEIEAVLSFTKDEHGKFLNDIKEKNKIQISNIDNSVKNLQEQIVNIDRKIELYEKNVINLEEQMKFVLESLKNINSLDPSIAALKLMEKRDISNDIISNKSQLFDLMIKKESISNLEINKLIERKKILESLTLDYNIKNSDIVGKIQINDYPVKPKKTLVVVVSFVTGFILSIFIIFFMQFIQGLKKEEN
jgi:LPS O-antigen subunit length determinant protein (WzzB/FepE family)